VPERVRHQRPHDKGEYKNADDYGYTYKDAVRDQEQGRREQEKARKTGEKVLEATDTLLEEIDEILAETIGDESEQQFINNFQQKGGE